MGKSHQNGLEENNLPSSPSNSSANNNGILLEVSILGFTFKYSAAKGTKGLGWLFFGFLLVTLIIIVARLFLISYLLAHGFNLKLVKDISELVFLVI